MAMLHEIVLIVIFLCFGRQQHVVSSCGLKGEHVSYNGYCYALHHRDSWSEAMSFCQVYGGELASILTPKEDIFIKDTFFTTFAEYWIGLNTIDDGIYKWSDNSTVSYVNFAPNPHGCDKSLLCVAISLFGQWRHYNCKQAQPFICKARDNATLTAYIPNPTPKAVVSYGCPPNFHSVPGASHCYHVGGQSHSEHKNFTEAIDACQALQPGAMLASIHSGIDQRFVTTLLDGLSANALIGFKGQRRQSDGLRFEHKKDAPPAGYLFEWEDKTQIDQVYWSQCEPMSPVSYRDNPNALCAYMTNESQAAGRWVTNSCDRRAAYVCGHPKDPKFHVEIRYNKGCPTGFQKFRNSCYKFFKDPKTWTEAETECVKKNGHIASLHNKYETAFIELLIDNGRDAWIGLSYNKTTQQYVWSDGWPVIFTDWGSQEVMPNRCTIDIFDGGWQTVSCDSKQPFVCEIDNDSLVRVTSHVPSTTSSPVSSKTDSLVKVTSHAASTTPSPVSSKTGNNSSRMSAGAIAGIAIGVVAILALVVAITVLTRKYYLKQRMNQDVISLENVNYADRQ